MNYQEKVSQENAIQIGKSIWWVGYYIPDDSFQCHVYLIENGDQSILIDPGSHITFEHTLKKIKSVTDFNNIRYFIFHHQDPDITSAMKTAETLIERKDACIVTHWRAETLLKHYDLKIPFMRVEENNWELIAGDRKLKFIFTPYLHFPGAFCSFDELTGILFSSDLFGGFTEGFQLYAEDEKYFESIRPFHEHYMPSREILQYGIQQLENYPIEMIAPQHGSIIRKSLVPFIMEKLKNLDCGLFAYARKGIDIQRLSKLNSSLREITNAMILYREFREVAKRLLQIIRNYLHSARSIDFYTFIEHGSVLKFCEENRFRGVKVESLPHGLDEFVEITQDEWKNNFGNPYLDIKSKDKQRAIIIPLFSMQDRLLKSAVVLNFSGNIESDFELKTVVEEISLPLETALEREVLFYLLDEDRQRYYKQSIHDPLTGLYTRVYMYDAMQSMFSLHDRDKSITISLIMADLDQFKKINDDYGHLVGDEILKEVARHLKSTLRESDIAVRMGGEEFAIYMLKESNKEVEKTAEKIRALIEKESGNFSTIQESLTISLGVVHRTQGETINHLIERADKALFTAKSGGRNRVHIE